MSPIDGLTRVDHETPEIAGYHQFERYNKHLGIKMSIVPIMLGTDQGMKRVNSEVTVSFFDDKTNNSIGEPFIISIDDIPGLDFSNPDQIQEIFGKYGDKFEKLDSRQESGLASQVFVDIIEKRERDKQIQKATPL